MKELQELTPEKIAEMDYYTRSKILFDVVNEAQQKLQLVIQMVALDTREVKEKQEDHGKKE